jgi:hypothetical protein
MSLSLAVTCLLLQSPPLLPTHAAASVMAFAEDQDPSVADFAGTYHYLGGQKQKKELEEAIERAIEDMFGPIKGLARRRLRETQEPRSSFTISVDGDIVSVGLPGPKLLKGRVDGPSFKFKGADGISRDTHIRQRGRSLVVTIKGNKDKTVFTYRLGKDGWLTMKTKIEHVRMPAPLAFRLTYKRS